MILLFAAWFGLIFLGVMCLIIGLGMIGVGVVPAMFILVGVGTLLVVLPEPPRR